jgi:hypothetical protein
MVPPREASVAMERRDCEHLWQMEDLFKDRKDRMNRVEGACAMMTRRKRVQRRAAVDVSRWPNRRGWSRNYRARSRRKQTASVCRFHDRRAQAQMLLHTEHFPTARYILNAAGPHCACSHTSHTSPVVAQLFTVRVPQLPLLLSTATSRD